jgi:hypothetical protein
VADFGIPLCCFQISQAVTAIESAWQAGIKRQRVELLLPLIGATDLDDWPGGIRQQFKAAAPLVEGMLRTGGWVPAQRNSSCCKTFLQASQGCCTVPALHKDVRGNA